MSASPYAAPAGVSALYSVRPNEPLRGDEEEVEPRGRACPRVAGVSGEQCLLPVEKAELPAEGGVRHGPVVHAPERAEERHEPPLQLRVVVERHEARAKHGAQRTVAEDEVTLAQDRVEVLVAGLGNVWLQELVVRLEHG